MILEKVENIFVTIYFSLNNISMLIISNIMHYVCVVLIIMLLYRINKMLMFSFWYSLRLRSGIAVPIIIGIAHRPPPSPLHWRGSKEERKEEDDREMLKTSYKELF